MVRVHHHRDFSGNLGIRHPVLVGQNPGHLRSGSAPASLPRVSRRHHRVNNREQTNEWPRPSPIATPDILEGSSLSAEVEPEPGSGSTYNPPRRGRARSTSIIAFAACVAVTAVSYITKSMLSTTNNAGHTTLNITPRFQILAHDQGQDASIANWAHPVKQCVDENMEPGMFRSEEASDPKAAIISLVTEDDLASTVRTVSSFEDQFNHRYGYDWVFFSHEDLSKDFRQAIGNSTNSVCIFERIEQSKWSTPVNIDTRKVNKAMEEFEKHGINRAWMLNTRHSSRWNSGLFAQEKRLDNYDWFWRINPGTTFNQPISHDIFRFMRKNNIAFGTDSENVYSVHANKDMWRHVRTFVNNRPDLMHPKSPIDYLLKAVETGHDELDVLTDDYGHNGLWCKASNIKNIFPTRGTINLAMDAVPDLHCQDCPSFMVGSIKAFRGRAFQQFFKQLDYSGIFYYTAVSDDFVHRLAMTMFEDPRKSWFFDGLGASPGICDLCPLGLLSDHASEDELPYDYQADTEDLEAQRNESFGFQHFEEMSGEMHIRLGGLEISKLESGQTFNIFRVAEQEGVRIDIHLDDEEDEPMLTLPDSPMEKDTEFAEDIWTEQFVRSLQGGH